MENEIKVTALLENLQEVLSFVDAFAEEAGVLT